MEKLGKHKHVLTNILKVAIFSLVMLAPLLAVGSKCLYVACNKNAYQSYSKEKMQTNVETLNINTGLTYLYNWFDETNGQTNNTTPLIKIQNISIEINPLTTQIRFTNDNKINQYDINGTTLGYIENVNGCTFAVSENITLQSQPWFKTYLITEIQQTLDNAFYYAFDQIAEEPLFNWTTETGTYVAINSMMTGLGLSNNHPLTICLCYWFIIMMIYIVVDIIVVCFTKLTHFYSDGD